MNVLRHGEHYKREQSEAEILVEWILFLPFSLFRDASSSFIFHPSSFFFPCERNGWALAQ